MSTIDESHLPALLSTAGKHIAELPGARRVVARMRAVDSAKDLSFLLQSVDLGLDEPARQSIVQAAQDDARWREVHATIVRSAEQQLTDRFSSSS